MKTKFLSLVIIIFSTSLFGQIQFSGNVNPSNLYQLSDAREISLPFRLASLRLSYAYRDLELVTTSALEYRWRNGHATYDLREAYIVWYPTFGEVSFGKQIFAWGMADGNNPTDNLSAYDYYYLFDSGTARKIGSLSCSVKWYLGNWQFQAVVIPKHQADRLVYEEDFPIKPPLHPKPSQIRDVAHETEYGLRVQNTFGNSDVAVSWFQGHDRLFSADLFSTIPQLHPVGFSYRKTDVAGLDMVTFLNDFTFRNELAYFYTRTEPDGFVVEINIPVDLSAWSLQYVSQVEYAGFDNFTLMAQVIGNHVASVTTTPSGFESTFVQGMGTPFASFLNRALIISANTSILDNRLDLKPMVMANLERQGFMAGLELDYSPLEGVTLEFSLNDFSGDDHLGPDYVFNQLEDFSNFRLGIKYSF